MITSIVQRSIESLQLWYTHLGLGKEESVYFKHLGEIKVLSVHANMHACMNA